jgi:ABC-2 type transport system permease protein
VRLARTGPAGELDFCTGVFGQSGPDGEAVESRAPIEEPEPDRSVVWPYGLAANLLLGAGGLAVAVRRLAIPQRTLPRGTRVA